MARDYHEVRMGEFAPLHAYLVAQKGGGTVALSFERIEEILGFELPGVQLLEVPNRWVATAV